MTQTARDLESTFVHAWELLARNWVLVLPGLVLAVLSAVAQFVFVVIILGAYVITGNGSQDALVASHALVAIVIVVITIAFALAQMAYVTGMAGGAWQHGRTTLRDGWDALVHRFGPILFAAALLFLIGLCAAVLSTVTFLVPLAVYAVFFIYTMASVIIGGRGPADAIAESARVAMRNFWPTAGVVVLIAVISVAGAWIGDLLGHVSAFAGWLLAGVLQQVIVAYASLVVAGEYLKLTNQPTA
ncbi:MAG: hypothetical protein JO322_02375 [Candidatus Eremiobacteraeota bacterium]|nr:hypothetical protein [Candidatus Eremiobacteraeota bacterium]